jgi:alpha-acetolactate decarboxylase
MKDVSLAFFSVFLLASVSQSHAGQQSEKERAKHEHSHESGLASHTKNTVHQYSPTIALLNSIYEGDLTPQQMVQQGNIGLGTVNQLAGELIAVDGIVYTIDAEGGIKKAPKDLKSPNMTMINFQPKQTLEISNITSYGDLNDALNKHRTSKNSFYAYKIKGDFKYLKMASAHKVKNEDVSLFEYLDTRVMYTRENIKGTLVGLFTPNYLGNIVIPGMHFHFLSNDIKLGGHLEDIKFDHLTVEVQEVNQVNLQLPQVEKFRTRELKDVKPPKATADKPLVEVSKVLGSDFSLTKKWEVSGFKMPESVFASADHPWLYVSNVNGSDPGFISRVTKDGTVDNYKWATGLNSPTGSDIYQNKLYVADTRQLHAIDLDTGKIIESFTADDAISLNDVAIDQRNGEVFISDVPGGKVYHLKEGKLSLWFESSEIPYPNGVLVQGNTLIVANYAVKNGKGLMRKEWGPDDFGTIYKVDIDTKAVLDIPSSASKGGYDGVVEFNGVLMASSAPTGQILTFEDNKSYLIDSTDISVADINTDAKTIYAPYLFKNKLTAFEPIAWDRVTTKEEYLKKGADNYYGDAGGKSIATHDGIIKGIFGGQQLTGTWDWEGEYFCRTSMLGKMDLGSDCIQIDVTEDKMRLVLNKGTGMSVVYDKKPKNDEITVLSTFKINADKIDLYKKEMLGNQDIVRKESGTLEMKLFQDKSDPTNFIVFGRNEGAAALTSHSENVEDRGIAERVKPALAEAPKTLFLINQKPLLTQDVEIYNSDEDDVLLFFMFDVQEAHRDEFIEQLSTHTESTRKEEGNIRFDFYALKDNQNTFVIQEHWKNEAAGVLHREYAYTKKTGKMMIEAIGDLKQHAYFVNQIEK